jgi:hypothetical protein
VVILAFTHENGITGSTDPYIVVNVARSAIQKTFREHTIGEISSLLQSKFYNLTKLRQHVGRGMIECGKAREIALIGILTSLLLLKYLFQSINPVAGPRLSCRAIATRKDVGIVKIGCI